MTGGASDAGRIAGTVEPRVRRLLYPESDPGAVVTELQLSTQVDLAHVVMLAERGLLARAHARCLVAGVRSLRREGFASVVGAELPRGVYLAYETALTARVGDDAGGRLHTGRSRNDLKATVTELRMRAALLDLFGSLARTGCALLAQARRHRDTVMALHTHFQPALPATLGYYLCGVAHALGRDLRGIRQAVEELRACPLGAGAAAGSELAIDPNRVATLLGFEHAAAHALDAVASRDTALRAAGAATSAALTLSRLAADLQLWSTEEFGFVHFPDHLVGGSSAMPQKRNAFLLEHVKAKAGVVTGAWTAIASLTRGVPFTNSIEVGTEALAALWPGLQAAGDASVLARVCVSGMRGDPDRMRAHLDGSFVGATAYANRLVAAGVPFRVAHRTVGRAVREALARGERGSAALRVPGVAPPVDVDGAALVGAQRYGAGPGDFATGYAAIHAQLRADRAWHAAMRRRDRDARAALGDAVAALAGGGRSEGEASEIRADAHPG